MRLFPLHFQADMILNFLVIKSTHLPPGYEVALQIPRDKNSLSFPQKMSSSQTPLYYATCNKGRSHTCERPRQANTLAPRKTDIL
jgi:hypothetical protein